MELQRAPRHAPPPLVASWLEVQPLCPDAPEGEAEPWVPLLVLVRRAHVFVVPPTLYSLYEGREGFRDAVGVADSPLLLSCTILASLHLYHAITPLCSEAKGGAGRHSQ